MVIVIKGSEYSLTDPSSPSLASEVLDLWATHRARSAGAAIGSCCPRLSRQCGAGSGPADMRYDLCAYGGRIYDALIADRVPASEVMEAARICMEMLAASYPTEPEVAADADFSDATP